jgi:DNA-binding transcriptional ArsR family regulator
MTEERIDAVFSALSDPTRRTVMRAISSHGEASATELAAQLPVSRQAIIKHLSALSEAGLVASDRAGRQRRYRLTAWVFGGAPPHPLSRSHTFRRFPFGARCGNKGRK